MPLFHKDLVLRALEIINKNEELRPRKFVTCPKLSSYLTYL